MADPLAPRPLSLPPLRFPSFPLPLPTPPTVPAPTPPEGAPLPLQVVMGALPKPSDFLEPLRDGAQALLNSTVGLAARTVESLFRSLPPPPSPPAPPAAR